MDFKDYYKILGVEKSATADEIKAAYRKLARKFHPDTSKEENAEDKFKDISEAYEVLKDPEKRSKYDNLGANWNRHRQSGGTNNDFNWENYFRQEQRRRQGGNTVGDFFNQGGGLSDFFERIFGSTYGQQGSGFGGFRQNPTQGQDVETELTLTLEEAYQGVNKVISVNGSKIEVKFKPGINTGQTLKISGKGKPGLNGGPAGSLVIKVKVQEHKKLHRDGNDLRVDADIDVFKMMLGGSATINTLSGKIKFNIPEASQNGKVLKLSNQGMPVYGDTEKKGNLYIKLNAKLPSKLSDADKELIKQIKK